MAHNASRGGRQGLLVLTAGPVSCGYRRYPTGRVARPDAIERAGVLALFLARGPNRGMGRREDMTRTALGQAARRRGELARDLASRRVSSAIDAQRRLNPAPVQSAWTKTDPLGPSNPRNAYLARRYD
jgi:hypothetical protein